MKEVNMRFWWWIYRIIGFKEYAPRCAFLKMENWAFGIWNEYDDWLFNGVHGFRIFGLEFEVKPRWLDRLFWKVLPIIRLVNRRPERVR